MTIKKFRRVSRSRSIKLISQKFFRATVEVGDASASAPLGPLLGQLQVPLLEFCNSFNDYSVTEYYDAIDLRLQLTKIGPKYVYMIKYPTVSFFIHQFYLDYGWDLEEFIYTNYEIARLDLWYLIQTYSSVRNVSQIELTKMVFGYFHTSIVQAIYLAYNLIFGKMVTMLSKQEQNSEITPFSVSANLLVLKATSVYGISAAVNKYEDTFQEFLYQIFGLIIYSDSYVNVRNFKFQQFYRYSIFSSDSQSVVNMSLPYFIFFHVLQNLSNYDLFQVELFDGIVQNDFDNIHQRLLNITNFFYYIKLGSTIALSYKEFCYFIQFIEQSLAQVGVNSNVILFMLRNLCFSFLSLLTFIIEK